MNRSTPARARTVSLTWVVVVALVVGGGAVAATAAYYALRAPAPGGSLTVTDDLGRTVHLNPDPARVLVLGPSIMDVMFRLGLRSHVVGVDCGPPVDGGLSLDYSPDQVSLWNLSPAMCVETSPELIPEQVANLTPQLVLAATIVSVAAVQTITDQLGIPVVMLQPSTLGGILADVSLVGVVFGVTAAADTLNAALSADLVTAANVTANVTSNYSNPAPFPSVLITYAVDANGYWTFGPGTFGESLLEEAGGASISGSAQLPYPELSPAQVLAAAPQLIIYGVGFGLNESTYAGGPDWSQFSAVQSGQVFGINSNWLTEADPTMIVDGLPALLAILHPGVP